MHAKAAANAEIDQFRREIAAAILSEIEGLSVREAEPLTGLRPITISRLRRGLAREFALEGLIGAAMKLGLPVKIHIGKRPPPKRKDGRQGTRRPKQTRADQIAQRG